MTWQTRPGGHLWLWILTSSFVAGLFLPGVRRWVHSLALTGQFGASTVTWECLSASPTAHVPLMYQWDTNVDGVSSVFPVRPVFPLPINPHRHLEQSLQSCLCHRWGKQGLETATVLPRMDMSLSICWRNWSPLCALWHGHPFSG